MLQIKDLVKRYEGTAQPALSGVNLHVADGELVGVLGLSGAGKSTLLRCINGLVQPTAGEVRYRGRRIDADPGAELRALRQEIGMVFQGFNLIDRLTVLQNVLVGRLGSVGFWQAVTGRWSRQDQELALDALARVGLANHATKRVTEISGGQRQRVAIARALVQQPRLLLADEPVSNLDLVTAQQIMELLRSVRDETGIAVIINLHSVELVRAFASRAVGIAGGRAVFDGSPRDLTDAELKRIYGAQLQ